MLRETDMPLLSFLMVILRQLTGTATKQKQENKDRRDNDECKTEACCAGGKK